jgi:hypothetical protein
MKCQQCNRQVSDDAAYCPHCGERLNMHKPLPMANMPDDLSGNAVDRLQPNVRRGGKQPPEEELWSDSYSPKALLVPFIAIDVLVVLAIVGKFLLDGVEMWWIVLGAVVLFGSLGLVLMYQRLSVRYRLTTYRFFHERGLLARSTDRVEVIDIDDVTVHQTLIDRMLGIGTIIIQSSDRTNPVLRLPGIDEVKKIADLIDATCRAERQRRAIHIESV